MAQVPSNAPAYNPYKAASSAFSRLSGVANQARSSFQPPKPQVLGASTGPSQSQQNNQPQQNNQQPQYDALQAQQDSINQQLEADYNQAMSSLSSQESGLQGQASTATAQINNDIAAGKTELQSGQTTQQQGVQANLQTGEKNATSAMQQARDVFRQTQQSNIAQLSALGISSSSVAEALAERLGVETARRIAGVTGSLNEIRQNASVELGRINKYYTEKTTQLEEQGRIQRDQIQQALVQGLNQINSARQKAASDKAARRQELLSQVSSSIAQLTQQQQQFQQSLQQWAQQKASALTPIAQDPNYVQNLIAQTQELNKQFQTTGFVATPSFNVNKEGTYTGQINFNKKPEVDQFGNPIDSNQPPSWLQAQ